MGNSVTIVGRPNVGKSSLFNRLVGRKRSLVHEEAGTTRDRIEARCTFNESAWTLVDTGGMLLTEKDLLSRQVLSQVNRAIKESDLLLFVVDTKAGCLPLDSEIAALLRKASKPILLVANKADNQSLSESAVDFYPLGLGEPIPVSSTHGTGIDELKERLAKIFRGGEEEAQTSSIRISVVGRPNVGKSSFLNALLKDNRLVVDDLPGTTRDPVDIQFKRGDQTYTVVDTAGIRRFSQIKEAVLFQSVRTTREMIQKSDVCLVLADGSKALQRDDLQILRWVIEEGRGALLLMNKWDIVKEGVQEDAEKLIRQRLGTLNIVPVLFTSAVTGRNVVKAVDMAAEVAARHSAHFETHRLNTFLQEIRRGRGLFPGGKIPRITYLVQTRSCPPRFLLFGSLEKEIFTSFTRFLERKMREHFPLSGTPVQFELRQERKKK